MTRIWQSLGLVAGVIGISAVLVGQDRAGSSRPPSHGQRRLAALHRRHPRHASTRRSIRSTPRNFNKLEVAWRFKTDILGPRPEYKLEGTPLADQRRALHDRRHAALGRRARRQDRRADLGAQPARRAARRRSSPRQLSGRGRLVLDRRPRRRAHPLRHDRLSARRAQREDRRADQRRSARTASSI